MSRFAVRLPILALLLALPALSTPAQKEHRLRVSPTFKVGDVLDVRLRWEQNFSMFELESGQQTGVTNEIQNYHRRYEILENGSDGAPTRLRACIVAAKKVNKVTSTGQAPVKTSVGVKNIWFEIRRVDGELQPDSATVRFPEGTLLDDRQQAFLREEFLDGGFEMPFSPDESQCLLPRQPVAEGGRWTPDRAALERFAKDRGFYSGPNTKFNRVAFSLAAVRDGVAHVTGRMQVATAYQNLPITMDLVLTQKLDLKSGHWLGRTYRVKSTVEEATGKTTVTSKCSEQGSVSSGNSAPPRNLVAPAVPIGVHANEKYGYRIQLPVGYAPHPAGIVRDVIASFHRPDSAYLQVKILEQRKPIRLKSLFATIVFKLKNGKFDSLVETPRATIRPVSDVASR